MEGVTESRDSRFPVHLEPYAGTWRNGKASAVSCRVAISNGEDATESLDRTTASRGEELRGEALFP